MLAYDFPILGLFWTMLIFFIWVAWILLIFRTVMDVFRSDDLGGGMKAFWVIFIVIIPWFGVLVYLIARGGGMAQRQIAEQQAQQDAFASYVRQTAGSGTSAGDELSKLADLRERGVITDAEFAAQKSKLLA